MAVSFGMFGSIRSVDAQLWLRKAVYQACQGFEDGSLSADTSLQAETLQGRFLGRCQADIDLLGLGRAGAGRDEGRSRSKHGEYLKVGRFL